MHLNKGENNVVGFKTIGECSVELKAHTTAVGVDTQFLPVAAARASFGKQDKTGKDEAADLKLMRTLAREKHVSCFEHNYATLLVECPLFVARQIMRHKSFNFNEVSRRYTSEDIQFWVPDTLREQGVTNKQGSGGDIENTQRLQLEMERSFDECLGLYEGFLLQGVCREQARAVLPQSMLTQFYMTGNLRSWWSYFKARLKEDTQYETSVISGKMFSTLSDLWPVPVSQLMEY